MAPRRKRARKTAEAPLTLPSGEYYVGDPNTYRVPYKGRETTDPTLFIMKGGDVFFRVETEPGTYQDTKGRYFVSYGNISCVPMTEDMQTYFWDHDQNFGDIIFFDKPFSCTRTEKQIMIGDKVTLNLDATYNDVDLSEPLDPELKALYEARG